MRLGMKRGVADVGETNEETRFSPTFIKYARSVNDPYILITNTHCRGQLKTMRFVIHV